METTNQIKLTMQALWQLLQPSIAYDTRGRYERCSRDWNAMDEAQQLRVYQILEEHITHGEGVNPNPYYALNDAMQEDEQRQAKVKSSGRTAPIDWNGKRAPEPTEIACYNGHWGMYTVTDIMRYGLQQKKRAI